MRIVGNDKGRYWFSSPSPYSSSWPWPPSGSTWGTCTAFVTSFSDLRMRALAGGSRFIEPDASWSPNPSDPVMAGADARARDYATGTSS